MQTVTVEWLKKVEALKEVPEDQLQWMIDNSRHLSSPQGEYIFKAGDPAVGTYIVLEGKIRLYMKQNNEMRDFSDLEAGSVSGLLPFSRAFVINVFAKVIEEATIMILPKEKFREMVSRHFELTQALVHVMTTRVRDFTSLQQQNEKMMALGKLSAGLAHELNNPAAAIVRGSASLKQHLQLVPEAFKEVIAIRMDDREVDLVNNKLFEVLGRPDKPKMTLMERTEREDEIRDWMDDHQVAQSGEIAENFMEYGFTCDDLRVFKEHIPLKSLSPVFNWINSNLVTERMVQDILESSQRISNLVSSVKNFTHMDQGKGKERTDIHTGIRNTLIMLQHELKKGQVQLTEEFDDSLPPIMALVGELNQVWTNLIDNALDAMEVNGKGQLIIRTEKDQSYAKVSIIDNGPGIPADVQSRIFDPFFTTKDIGKGTGLGLDVVTRIVKQHRGSVRVQSVPGRTEFIVCFPIDG
ncbi:MAG TPA: ATP-binding protein [Puia sp.]|jgi:signal transduction histidine kinase|nr:ATP-binding protein [Puia sp.]